VRNVKCDLSPSPYRVVAAYTVWGTWKLGNSVHWLLRNFYYTLDCCEHHLPTGKFCAIFEKHVCNLISVQKLESVEGKTKCNWKRSSDRPAHSARDVVTLLVDVRQSLNLWMKQETGDRGRFVFMSIEDCWSDS